MNRFLLMLFCLVTAAAVSGAWEDHTHNSAEFGVEKTYRIYFPDSYGSGTDRYPVIYFFHGWGGRYNADPNAKYDSTLIESMVAAGEVLMVFWDGNMMADPYEPRPYNVGNHQHVRFQTQMKNYFPELVGHIDSTYRTIPDRAHRALYGYSMGGFTGWLIAGTYPHMVCAAVNMLGSAEFFAGYPDNHTLYSHRHMCANLHGLHLFQHNSSSGELVFLNREVNRGALRETGLSYEYKAYPGGHGIDNPGEISVFKEHFDWLTAKMDSVLPPPSRWHHSDIYQSFDVWGYSVSSDKTVPGFIAMEGVTKGGMRLQTKKWEPHGPAVPGVTVNVITDTLYDPNEAYSVYLFSPWSDSAETRTVTSDAAGRVSFSTDGTPLQIGIFKDGDPGEPVLVNYRTGPDGTGLWLEQGQPMDLKIRLLNRGGSGLAGLTARLSSPEAVTVSDSVAAAGDIGAGSAAWASDVFRVSVGKTAPVIDEPWRVRFDLTITDAAGSTWTDEFDVPVMYDVGAFSSIEIDDGVMVKDRVFGTGNGNGRIDPGEKVMMYTNGHRMRLYTEDPFVVPEEEELHDEALPAVWTDDGITLTSIVKIDDGTPPGHPFTFLAKYESKAFNPIYRMCRWGKVAETADFGGKHPEKDPVRMNSNVPNPWFKHRGVALAGAGMVRLDNLKGKTVYRHRGADPDIALVPAGIYVCEIVQEGGAVYRDRVMILD